jgi:hypothetical protein
MLYLLAYDVRKERMTARGELGYVLRAAALTELQIAGHIADEGGRPRAQAPTALGDPFLNDLLQDIANSRPRSWQRWISTKASKASRQVRDSLASAQIVRLTPYRALGVFPATRVTVEDPRVVERLAKRVAETLSDSRPLSRIEPRDAAMVSLAAAGEFKTVLPRPRRREHRQRLADLSEATEPLSKALRKAIQQTRNSG